MAENDDININLGKQIPPFPLCWKSKFCRITRRTERLETPIETTKWSDEEGVEYIQKGDILNIDAIKRLYTYFKKNLENSIIKPLILNVFIQFGNELKSSLIAH